MLIRTCVKFIVHFWSQVGRPHVSPNLIFSVVNPVASCDLKVFLLNKVIAAIKRLFEIFYFSTNGRLGRIEGSSVTDSACFEPILVDIGCRFLLPVIV